MKKRIQSELRAIEERERCRILLAVESGSRAWGFASQDSDYDVRFVYLRPLSAYLKLNRDRDVIEIPVGPVLDINGWDLDKTLKLIHRSNPTVFEWFSSPICYRSTPAAEQIRQVMDEYYVPKNGFWHYLSMAKGNRRNYFQAEEIKLKRYFYVLRPVLACRWILEKGAPPPMAFQELVECQLPAELQGLVRELIDRKRAATEVTMIPQIGVLNRYLSESIEELEGLAETLPAGPAKGWEELDRLFLRLLQEKE